MREENITLWRQTKKSTHSRICAPPHRRAQLTAGNEKQEWGAAEFLPDIFQVTVWRQSKLFLCRLVELLGKLPQAGSMEDPCRSKRHQHQQTPMAAAACRGDMSEPGGVCSGIQRLPWLVVYLL